MKECKIVEDLLPLYKEKLLSKESIEFVEKHLTECEDCKIILTKEDEIDLNVSNKNVINKINKKLRIRTLKSMGVVFLMCICLFLLVLSNLLEKNFISKNEIQMKFEEVNNELWVELDQPVSGININPHINELSDDNAYTLQIYNYYFNGKIINGDNRFKIGTNVDLLFYSSPNEPSVIVYGSNNQFEDSGFFILDRLIIGMYCSLCLIIIIILSIIYMLVRKKALLKNIIENVILFPINFIICAILVTNFDFSTPNSTMHLFIIIAMCICSTIGLVIAKGMFKEYLIEDN